MNQSAPSPSAWRKLLAALPGVRAAGKAWRRYRRRRKFSQLGDAKAVFEHHYQSNKWGSQESVSGPGSTLEYTANIREKLPELFDRLEARKLLDAPCGDYNWLNTIQWHTPIEYVGGDIVDDLIARNQREFATDTRNFQTINIIRDPLPAADVWLCRDCLFHLSVDDIVGAIQNFLASDIRYLLTSTHHLCEENRDIATGDFRLLNLELPPYSFGSPMESMDDWIEGFPPRKLALWERSTLAERLADNRDWQQLVAKHSKAGAR